jgi:hypothetical protein
MRRETFGFPNYVISLMLPLVPLCEVQIFHPVIFILNLADGHEVGNYVNTALFRKMCLEMLVGMSYANITELLGRRMAQVCFAYN